MATAPDHVLLTCEHGGNRIPDEFKRLFLGRETLLASHRGWDIGALSCARSWARALGLPLISATVSRLVVDLNRSEWNPTLFSEITERLPPEERERVLRRYWRPYRERVEQTVASAVAEGRRVLHLSVHSFTPALGDLVRKADVGLLYDPRRPGEKALCARWGAILRDRHPEWKVRMNYPYLGVADGLVTRLRKRFPASRYIGVELEMNQGRFSSVPEGRAYSRELLESLRVLLQR